MYVVFKLLIDAVGLNETLLRIPTVIAYFVGVVSTVVAARPISSAWGRVTAVGTVAFSFVALNYAVMFKQYSFELAASAVIVAAGAHLLHKQLDARAVALFTVLSIVVLPFSNTSVFVTLATLAAVLILEAWRAGRVVRSELVLPLIAGGVYLAVFAGLVCTMLANVPGVGVYRCD